MVNNIWESEPSGFLVEIWRDPVNVAREKIVRSILMCVINKTGKDLRCVAAFESVNI